MYVYIYKTPNLSWSVSQGDQISVRRPGHVQNGVGELFLPDLVKSRHFWTLQKERSPLVQTPSVLITCIIVLQSTDRFRITDCCRLLLWVTAVMMNVDQSIVNWNFPCTTVVYDKTRVTNVTIPPMLHNISLILDFTHLLDKRRLMMNSTIKLAF